MGTYFELLHFVCVYLDVYGLNLCKKSGEHFLHSFLTSKSFLLTMQTTKYISSLPLCVLIPAQTYIVAFIFKPEHAYHPFI